MANYTANDVLEDTLKYFNGDELAASAFVTKYALKQTTDNAVVYKELSPDDMHDRLASEFYRIEQKYPNPRSYKEIREALDRFKYIVPGGSVMYGAGNIYKNVSLSNCVALAGPKDSVTGIFDKGRDMANLFKARAGVGIPLDTLRPDGSMVNNSAGTSTGAWSFANYYSEVCKTIGQQGRRGALILTLNVKHLDIEKFVTMKQELNKVTGANISVMITDDFMEAVKDNDNWTLQWPIDVPLNQAKYVSVVRAKKIWDLICECATKTAEPGIIFIDNYKKNLPADYYPDFKSVCVNPCGEVLLSSMDSCRLTSINLKSFVINPYSNKPVFDFNKFEEIVRLSMRILDNIVDLEIECVQKIINKVDEKSEKELWTKLMEAGQKGRRTGLGTHGMADVLIGLKLRYDTIEAQEMIKKIYECLRNNAYGESINMAIERGAFSCFDWEIEKNCDYIQRLPEEIQDKIKKYGRRNISLLTNAPTGTVSIMSQTSSGIEPVFMRSYTRRKKVNSSDTESKVDYTDDMGDKWGEFPVVHHAISEYLQLEKNKELNDEWINIQNTVKSEDWETSLAGLLPDYFVTAMDIDPYERVNMQGALTAYLDHGSSSTVNLPKGTSVATVQDVYERAWEAGLKGVTVYVDGSRDGILAAKKEVKPHEIQDSVAPKRPKELPCEIHRSTIDDQKWTILVGLLNGRPYEIFGGLAEHIPISRRCTEGKIVKRACQEKNAKGRYSCYDLVLDEEGKDVIQDIAVAFNDGNYAAQTRMISLSLRHGVPLSYIVEQLNRDLNSDLFSFSKVMSRILKKYITDGTDSSENCPECGTKLRFESGCVSCPNCAHSKCS
jgi:ribonucleoside-diphosphate reductase alpha chain